MLEFGSRRREALAHAVSSSALAFFITPPNSSRLRTPSHKRTVVILYGAGVPFVVCLTMAWDFGRLAESRD